VYGTVARQVSDLSGRGEYNSYSWWHGSMETFVIPQVDNPAYIAVIANFSFESWQDKTAGNFAAITALASFLDTTTSLIDSPLDY